MSDRHLKQKAKPIMMQHLTKRSKLLGPSRDVRIHHRESTKTTKSNKDGLLSKQMEEALENKMVCDQLDALMEDGNSMRKLLL